jgi:hypothetical protein
MKSDLSTPRRSSFVETIVLIGNGSTIFLGITTAVFAWILRRDLWPALRGPAPFPIEWRWEWEPLGVWRAGPACVFGATIVAIAAVPLSRISWRAPRLVSRLMLCGAVVFGIAFQISLVHLRHDGAVVTLVERTLDSGINSYFTVANETRTIPVSNLLATYHTRLLTFPLHAMTHPPGAVLYYRAAIIGTERWPQIAREIASALKTHGPWQRRIPADASDVRVAAALTSALGLIMLASITCWPVAGIAESGGLGPLAAAQIGALWVVTPGPALFVPSFDQAVTCLVAFATWFALRALKGTSSAAVLFGVACGLTAGLATFSSFSAPPMLAAAGLVTMAAAVSTSVRAPRMMTVVASASAGFAALSVAPIIQGYHTLDVMMTALRLHRERWTLTRTRQLWWRYNLLDFGVFAGWPVLATLALRFQNLRYAVRPARLMFATGIGALLMLDAADVTRGEVGRLWMPLLALLLPLAIAAITPLVAARSDANRNTTAAFVVLVALQAAFCLSIRLSWDL